METLPLLLAPCPMHARIVHLDDAGRALDRARILLGSACEELMSAAHLAKMAAKVARLGLAFSPSNVRIVRTATSAFVARSSWVHFRRPRAARHWAGVMPTT